MYPTKQDFEVLDFVAGFIKKNNYAPTINEIGKHFNVSCYPAWHKIRRLQKKGNLLKWYKKPRAIEIPDNWDRRIELKKFFNL
jgi:repressor LexA